MIGKTVVAGLVLSLVLGCSSEDKKVSADVVADAVVDAVADTVPEIALPDVAEDVPADSVLADGLDETLDGDTAVATDGVRALRIEDSEQLIGGREAQGDVGDFLLANENVRFVVRGKDKGLYNPYSASLVDADLVRPEGEPGNDRFFELFPLVGLIRASRPVSLEIVDSGETTGRAVLRATGTDGGIPLIDSILVTKHLGLEVVVDYILESGTHHLEIVTTVRNPTDKTQVVPAGDLITFGDSLKPFAHQYGADLEATLGTDGQEWFAAAGDGVSYGLTAMPGTRMSVPLTREEVLVVQYGDQIMAPGDEFSVTRFFIVGDGTVDSIAAYAWELRGGKALGECRVALTGIGEGNPAGDIVVEALLDSEEDAKLAHISATNPDSYGTALLHLPSGTYDLHISRPGAPSATIEGVEVESGVLKEMPHVLAQPGQIHALVSDQFGNPMTVKLSLQPGHAAAWVAGIQQIVLVRDGDFTAPVLPGEYTATLSRGFEYDIHQEDITVVAGETVTVEGTLSRVVDTTGWISLDTHDHSELSIDSSILAEDRIYAAIAEGVEVFSLTDHDHFGTFQPVVEELGLENQIHCILGNEVSPLYGHQVGVGCSPMEYDQYFSMNWTLYDETDSFVRVKTPTEVWTEMRWGHGCELVAVAHPYCSQAMFEFYKLDENTDPASLDLDNMDVRLLDAIELINSHDEWDEIFTQNLPGWANLVNRGYLLPVIGGSDSHAISQTIGHPRNLVLSDTDSPGDVNEGFLLGAIKSFHSEIYGGPFIRFSLEGKGLGETVVPEGDKVTAIIEIFAPAWMELGYVRLYGNGELLSEFDPAGTEILRLSETVELDVPSGDTWYVVAAGSETFRMGPVARNRPPISLTNPIWLDVDGEGFVAPMASQE